MSQSNNNLILIDHNSAYNPSNMGDNDESMQTENRVHNYIFGRQIGEGAYAVVRAATSREDNKKYAIKVYDKTKLSDINR
jgi:serine/threonine protein kinase